MSRPRSPGSHPGARPAEAISGLAPSPHLQTQGRSPVRSLGAGLHRLHRVHNWSSDGGLSGVRVAGRSDGEPAAFLSYAHGDGDHDDGLITAFRRRLEDEPRAQTGRRGLQIFQDRDDIAWGQAREDRIDRGIPRHHLVYVRSLACSLNTPSACSNRPSAGPRPGSAAPPQRTAGPGPSSPPTPSSSSERPRASDAFQRCRGWGRRPFNHRCTVLGSTPTGSCKSLDLHAT